MSTTKTLTVADVATKLNNLKSGESLTIRVKDFKPVVTEWAQANPGKTLWLNIQLTPGFVWPVQDALESSIRGKVKGAALRFFTFFGRPEYADCVVVVSPVTVEVKGDE